MMRSPQGRDGVLTYLTEALALLGMVLTFRLAALQSKEDLDLTGLDVSDDELEAALKVDVEEWKAELPSIDEWFHRLGHVPEPILEQRAGLEDRLNQA